MLFVTEYSAFNSKPFYERVGLLTCNEVAFYAYTVVTPRPIQVNTLLV